MDIQEKKILVTGGAGFLGSFVVEELMRSGVKKENIFIPHSKEYDLRDKAICQKVVAGQDVVIHLAANVGGIGYNREKPGELFYDNLMMGAQILDAAHRAGAEKFVGLATICSYPKFTPVPFREEDIWNGYPEETNAPYGLAKKMLLVQAQAYRLQYGFSAITLFPVNLYGPRDNFNLDSSHVIPALIRKAIEARDGGKASIEAWGTGTPTREFLYVEDAARAIVLATQKYDKPDPVNLGSGMEISIKDLTEKVCKLVGFTGQIKWDNSKPDGQPRRMLDISKAEKEFDFRARTNFDEGLAKTIQWYESHTN
ncbi:MAG: GDP-L-fucose synthase [Candidatus Ryanbacteria bacterium]|nr:GDP-L-fucose synthase [Candidatus Ryanbacteria bacterium]